MTLTVTLTGTSSELHANFFPPIQLPSNDYSIGLLSFDSYNSIPNIMKGKNDMFYYGNDKSIQIPEGTYELDAINTFLSEKLNEDGNIGFHLRGNTNTLKAELRCDVPVYFNFPDKPNSIGSLLGFNKPRTTIKPGGGYTSSDTIVEIFKVNAISVQCNLVSGSYQNGNPVHILHQFFPLSAPGYKIVETPSPVIYLPINTQTIYNLSVHLTDQDNNLIDFRGETITIRLHLKKNGD